MKKYQLYNISYVIYDFTIVYNIDITNDISYYSNMA